MRSEPEQDSAAKLVCEALKADLERIKTNLNTLQGIANNANQSNLLPELDRMDALIASISAQVRATAGQLVVDE